MTRHLVLLVLSLAVVGCRGYAVPEYAGPMTLGGQVVPARTLAGGAVGYTLYCRACHGEKGDGKGPSAQGLRPPPRDFTLGTFKFGAVSAGDLPHDEDLIRIVRGGLHGTAMLAWDVPEPTLVEIVQYLKTFSPRWRTEAPGEAVVSTPDPWAGKLPEGVSRGKQLYHGLAQCLGCHPAYASKKEIDQASRALTGNPTTDFREDMHGSVLKESDYGVKILPPDFTRVQPRSIRDDHRLEDLYRVIASGVGGTAMPAWKGSLPEEDIWALVHYVDSLLAMRDRPEAAVLRASNEAADASWQPAAPPGKE